MLGNLDSYFSDRKLLGQLAELTQYNSRKIHSRKSIRGNLYRIKWIKIRISIKIWCYYFAMAVAIWLLQHGFCNLMLLVLDFVPQQGKRGSWGFNRIPPGPGDFEGGFQSCIFWVRRCFFNWILGLSLTSLRARTNAANLCVLGQMLQISACSDKCCAFLLARTNAHGLFCLFLEKRRLVAWISKAVWSETRKNPLRRVGKSIRGNPQYLANVQQILRTSGTC